MESIFSWITSAVKSGVPVGIIATGVLGAILIIVCIRVIKYMMESKKEILAGINSNTNNHAMVSSSLTEVALSLGAITLQLNNLTKVDERIPEGQAVIIYGLMMNDVFNGDIKACYKSANDWLDSKGLDRSDEDVQIKIAERIEMSFQAIYKELEDRLRNFKYKNHYLNKYLDANFINEFDHVKDHVYAMLIESTNGINSYVNTKKSFFISDFNSYLRNDNSQ